MDQELKNKYNALPNDIKKAIDSTEMIDKISEIGLKQGLHVDQIGILEEEIGLVMLGDSPIEEFVDRIEDRLSIPTEKAIDITTQVNINIFVPIRESLMKVSSGENIVTTEPVKLSNEPGIKREDIMSEIENPTPSVQPISVEIPGPARPIEIMPAVKTKQESVAHEFIGSKLTETVNMPVQNITIKNEGQKTETKQKPQGYAADPYREPVS